MHTTHHPSTTRARRDRRYNLVSVATLFVAIVAVALMLIAIAQHGTNPLLILIPVAVGVISILDIRA